MQEPKEKEETIIVFRDEETLTPGELEEGDTYTGGEVYAGEVDEEQED